MTTPKRDAEPKLPKVRTAAGNDVRVLDTADLFGGGREIVIRHAGTVYRMKITRQGKLILNK